MRTERAGSSSRPAGPWLPRWLAMALLGWACSLACSPERSIGISLGERPDRAPQGDGKRTAPTASPDAVAAGELAVEHRVSAGQTLWAIARTYDTSVRAILDANQLRERDVHRLRPGQRLRIPGATEVRPVAPAAPNLAEREGLHRGPLVHHRLEMHETLWDVALHYDIGLERLMRHNGLDDDAVRRLRPGRRIALPGVTKKQLREARRQAGKRQGQRIGLVHRLAPGETIWDLARAFGVTTSEIMVANRLSPERARTLREGQRLRIPGVDRDDKGRFRRRRTRGQRRALRRAQRLGFVGRKTARALLHGRLEERWIRAATRSPRNRARRRTPGTLLWPVTRGWYVRGYGSGEGGYHLAVDIMGEMGWNVRAAAAGIVAYAGDEVPGYGNMVVMVHQGGWVTMYAHNAANLVVAGERVVRGGIIAEVGSTGISRGPHVHFEFIYDRQNCDPASLFRPGVRHRDGHLGAIKRTRWTEGKKPPRGISCAPRRRHPRSRWVNREGERHARAEGDPR